VLMSCKKSRIHESTTETGNRLPGAVETRVRLLADTCEVGAQCWSFPATKARFACALPDFRLLEIRCGATPQERRATWKASP
jgi:hypothetical protein